MKRVREESSGLVHLVAVNPEFTLCGIAHFQPEPELGKFTAGVKMPVTCPDCIATIEHCRWVRVKR